MDITDDKQVDENPSVKGLVYSNGNDAGDCCQSSSVRCICTEDQVCWEKCNKLECICALAMTRVFVWNALSGRSGQRVCRTDVEATDTQGDNEKITAVLRNVLEEGNIEVEACHTRDMRDDHEACSRQMSNPVSDVGAWSTKGSSMNGKTEAL